jgi:iron transport multicopper oxidase
MPAEDSYINGTTFESKAQYAKIYGAQTHAIVLNHMDTIELTIYNWDSGLHPFHVRPHRRNIFWPPPC